MKLSELGAETGARVEPESAGEIEITGAAGLDEAEPGREGLAVLRARDPYLAYTRALRLFHPEPRRQPSVHPSAVIDPSARVHESAYVGACAVVGRDVEVGARAEIHANATLYDGVRVGEDTVIHSGVALREGTIVGARVTVHNNAVVGSDGFGYAKDEEGRWLKIPQTGRVVIEDDVEIGAGATIDCASVGETRVGRGTKLDNLVQIGHSCTVGEDSLLCAQVGLAGSTRVGNRVILAGQAGVAGHLAIGDDVVLTAK